MEFYEKDVAFMGYLMASQSPGIYNGKLIGMFSVSRYIFTTDPTHNKLLKFRIIDKIYDGNIRDTSRRLKFS
jgi:hypothetical protein